MWPVLELPVLHILIKVIYENWKYECWQQAKIKTV
jgi:hypothetical protein